MGTVENYLYLESVVFYRELFSEFTFRRIK